jgi:sulfonate transport system permease protein
VNTARAWHSFASSLPPLLALALWQAAVQRHWLPQQILPAPSLVLQSLQELWSSGDLVAHLAVSLRRIAWSLLVGGGAGLVLGLAMGLSRSARAYLLPSFEVLAQCPVVGWIPLLMIFVGIDEALKVSAISIAVAVPVTVNAFKGVQDVPPKWLDVARTYRFTRSQTLLRVVLPAAAPSLFNGLRQGVMQAWLSLVFVELLASSEGIGFLMVWGRQLMQMDLVIAGMVVVGVVGVAIDLLMRAAQHALQRRGWR